MTSTKMIKGTIVIEFECKADEIDAVVEIAEEFTARDLADAYVDEIYVNEEDYV